VEIGDGSDFGRRSGNGLTAQLPPPRARIGKFAHESGSRAPNLQNPHQMVVA